MVFLIIYFSVILFLWILISILAGLKIIDIVDLDDFFGYVVLVIGWPFTLSVFIISFVIYWIFMTPYLIAKHFEDKWS